MLFSHSPYNQIKHCRSLESFCSQEEVPSQYSRVEIRKSVASAETVNLIIFEWPHWHVKENMAVYEVAVLYVNI